MINTVNTKSLQLAHGYFSIGSGNEIILIVGSCRSVPYAEYLHEWNKESNRFTICFIDPFNWNYDLNDNRIDLHEKINSLETDERILNLLKNTKIIIHEYYSNFGMFNFEKSADKNIYQFGLAPEIDICIPNFNDNFILVNDILKFNQDLRKKVEQDLNVIGRVSKQTEWDIYQESHNGLEKFRNVCMLSDLPELLGIFTDQWDKFRFFHSYNHVSKYFTLAVFRLMNEKFLHLPITEEFWEEISQQDMFANSYTKLTDLDVKFYGFDWGEEIVPLNL